jgi:hypothetical protein
MALPSLLLRVMVEKLSKRLALAVSAVDLIISYLLPAARGLLL